MAVSYNAEKSKVFMFSRQADRCLPATSSFFSLRFDWLGSLQVAPALFE